MFGLFKKKYTGGNTDFERGDIISNGKVRMIVNAVFDMNGEKKMLIDDVLWGRDDKTVIHTQEVSCKGWYKIR